VFISVALQAGMAQGPIFSISESCFLDICLDSLDVGKAHHKPLYVGDNKTRERGSQNVLDIMSL
jgi:hypothetical protein